MSTPKDGVREVVDLKAGVVSRFVTRYVPKYITRVISRFVTRLERVVTAVVTNWYLGDKLYTRVVTPTRYVVEVRVTSRVVTTPVTTGAKVVGVPAARAGKAPARPRPAVPIPR